MNVVFDDMVSYRDDLGRWITKFVAGDKSEGWTECDGVRVEGWTVKDGILNAYSTSTYTEANSKIKALWKKINEST